MSTAPSEQVFATPLVRVYFHSIWVLGGIVLILWPDLDMYEFINNPPVNFLLACILALLGVGYISLWIGRGEMVVKKTPSYYLSDPPYLRKVPESKDFYGVFKMLLHPLVLYLFLLPVLILAATLSAVEGDVFLRMLSVLVVTAWFCGFMGSFIRLTCNLKASQGYIVGRILYAGLFVGTEFAVPSFNPIRLLVDLFQNQTSLPAELEMTYYFYLTAALVGSVLFACSNHFFLKKASKSS